MKWTMVALGAAALLALITPACGSDRGDNQLLVLAPSSLADHLDDFNQPWIDDGGEFSFAGSTTQVRAVAEGADADVLITANPDVAVDLIDSGFIPRAVVTNSLAIVTPIGNPAAVTELSDLARDDLLIAVCAVEVPCGAATSQLQVSIAADTTEPNVRGVLTKVEEGIVDVGVVYETDAAIGRVDVPFELANTEETSTTYMAFNISNRRIASEYIDALLTIGRDDLVARGIGFDAP